MPYNAFILAWTMDRYDELQDTLANLGFVFERIDGTDHIRVQAPFERVHIFSAVCQPHMKAPFNYVDIQYPDRKTTVIVFAQAVHTVTTLADNDAVKAWALALGLPPEQADWATSF